MTAKQKKQERQFDSEAKRLRKEQISISKQDKELRLMNQKGSVLYDQSYDKRFTKVSSKYFKGNLFWDILACFPVLAYEIYRHQNKDECSSERDQYTTIYFVVYGLKLLKFTSMPKIK